MNIFEALIEFIKHIFPIMIKTTLLSNGWNLGLCIAFWISVILILGWLFKVIVFGFFTSGLWKICLYFIVGGIIFFIISFLSAIILT